MKQRTTNEQNNELKSNNQRTIFEQTNDYLMNKKMSE